MAKPNQRQQIRKPVARSAAGADAPSIRTDRSIRSLRAVENSFDPETRIFECVAATDTPVRAYRADGWNVVEVDEVLTISQEAIANWDRIPGTSIQIEHMPFLPDSVGVIRAARIEGGQLVLTCQLSSRADVDDLAQDVADGIIQNFSVYANLLDQSDPEERDGDVPLVTVRSWSLLELSFVAVPADQNARLRSMSKTKPAGTRGAGSLRRAAKKPAASLRARRSDDQVDDTEDEDTSERAASRREAEENVETLEAALEEARAALDEMGEDDDTERSDEEDDDTSERDGVDEDDEDDTQRPRSKRSAPKAGRTSTRSAAEQAQIKAFRAVAVRSKTVSAEEFDAFVAAGASIRSLLAITRSAFTKPSASINSIHQPIEGSVSTGGGTRLRSFDEFRAADAATRN